MQKIRDESHRFAVTYHRKRREMRDRDGELLDIPGVGPRTGSCWSASAACTAYVCSDATAVVNQATADVRKYFDRNC